MGGNLYALPSGFPTVAVRPPTHPVPVNSFVKKKYGSIEGRTEDAKSKSPRSTDEKYLAGEIRSNTRTQKRKATRRRFRITNYIKKTAEVCSTSAKNQ